MTIIDKMKSQKWLRFGVLISVSLFAFALLFAACDAGLGESVDTMAPTVSISSPASSAVLSGPIKVKGSCLDDKAIGSVSVTVKNTATGKKVGSYSASVSGNSWSVTLNKQSKGEYPMPDGTYSVSAVCYDAAGRQSGVASRVFEVDNTPPVFCVTSPNSLNIGDPAAYGRSVKIKGEIADDHPIASMDIRAFRVIKEADGSISSINEITNLAKSSFSGFETAGGTEVIIAQYYPDGQVPSANGDEYLLYQNYLALFGLRPGASEEEKSVLKKNSYIYIFPFLTDSAGNTSSNCYIQNQLKKEIVDACPDVETTSDSLQTAQFKKMINGSYSLGELDVDTVLQILDGSYEAPKYSYRAHMNKEDAEIGDSNALLAMSVNSDNAPRFEFGGYSVSGEVSTEAAAGGNISVKISAGLDGTYVKPGSLKVYLLECDEELNLLKPGADITKPDETADYISGTGDFKVTTDGSAEIPADAASVATGTYIVTLPSELFGGSRYRMIATGEDDAENKLDSDAAYAFKVPLRADAPSVDYEGQVFVNAKAISAACLDDDCYQAEIVIEDAVRASMDKPGSSLSIVPSLYVGYYPVKGDLKNLTPDWKGSEITIGYDKITETSAGKYKAIFNSNIFNLNDVKIKSADNFTVELKIWATNDVTKSEITQHIFWADNKKPELSIGSLKTGDKVTSDNKDIEAVKDGTGKIVGYNYNLSGNWGEVGEKGSGTYRLWMATSEIKYTPASGTADGSTVYYERETLGDGSFSYRSLGALTAGRAVSGEDWYYYTLGPLTEVADVPHTALKTQWDAKMLSVAESVGQTISVVASDAAGNMSDIATVKNVAFDFYLPTIKSKGEIKDCYNVNDLKFEFDLEDSLSLDTAAPIEVIAEKEKNGEYAVVTSGYSVSWEFAKDAGGNDDYKKAVAAIKLGNGAVADGKWRFSVSAKDLCGQKSDAEIFKTFETTVDRVAPQLADYSSSTRVAVKGDGTLDDWFKDATLNISGRFTEATSGIDKIYYFLETPSMQKNSGDTPYTVPTDLTVKSSTEIVEKHRGELQISTSGNTGTGVTYTISPTGFEEKIVYTPEGSTEQVECYNNLYIQAIDLAGNKSAIIGKNPDPVIQVKEDQTNPVISAAYYTYDGDTMVAASGNAMTNGKNDMTIYGAVNDALSGIKSLSFKIGEASVAATFEFSESACSTSDDYKGATYKALAKLEATKVKSWKAVIKKDALKTGELFAVAGDTAGNASDQKLFKLMVDNTPPTIELKSPATIEAGAATGTVKSIYGNVSFEGAANDDSNSLASVAIEYSVNYKPNKGTGDWTELAAKKTTDSEMYNWSAAAEGEKAISKASGSSYTMLGYGDALYNGSPKDFYIRITAVDKAGNSAAKIYQYSIAPELDRPKIAISDVNLDDMASNKHVWMIGSNKNEIYGKILDDDGVSALAATFEIYENGSWTTPTPAPELKLEDDGSGSFSITKLPDGMQRITFAVTDGKSTTYAAHDKTVSNYVAPYIYGSGDNPTIFGEGSNGKGDSLLYITVDTKAPSVHESQVFYYADKAGNYDSTKHSTLDKKLGGDWPMFKCVVNANDVNGIEEATLTVKDAKDKSGAAKTISVTSAPLATPDEDGVDGYQEIVLAGIDVGELASGTYTAEILVKDKAGQETPITAQISVDNDPPNVVISTPSSDNQVVMGISTTISGSTNEYGMETVGADDRAKVYYAVCPIGKSETVKTLPTSFDKWYNVDEGKYIDIKDATGKKKTVNTIPYENINIDGVSWKIAFDGDTNNADGTHASSLNDFIADYSITTAGKIADSSFGDIVRLYVWIKVVDEVGNVTEICRGLNVDPQGDRPIIAFNYPSENGTTVGDKVTLSGDVTDNFNDDPKTKDAVWIQIISDKDNPDSVHGSYDYTPGSTADPTGFTLVPADIYRWVTYKKGDDLLYSVYNMRTYVIGGSNTKLTTDDFYVDKDSKGNITNCSFRDQAVQVKDFPYYGILANFDGSTWDLAINSAGEFSDDNKSIEIAVRSYAYNGKRSSPSYKVMTFDKDAPDISDMYLRQYSGSEVSASRVYKDNIYVRDKNDSGNSANWYITFTLTDNSGVKYIGFSEVSVADAKENKKDVADMGDECVIREEGKYCDIKHKLNNYHEANAKETLYVYYEDGKENSPSTGHYTFIVNHDNKSPATSSSDKYMIKPDVSNNDLWYRMSAIAAENDNNDSGFARVVFYFKRSITIGADAGKVKIFDPMYSKGYKEGGKPVYYSFASDAGVVEKEGLYWKQKQATITNSTVVLASKDANIHIGGIVKIGGVIYTIKTIDANRTTLTIDSETEYNNKSMTVDFALGNVVDNTIAESEDRDFKKNISYEAGYGYGYGKVVDGSGEARRSHDNDDGDRMIESVDRAGTQYIWEARINSKNIPDGPIEICYTVYDAAGNYSAGSVSNAVVSNNAPRVSNIVVSTDYNGNDKIDEGESYTWFDTSKPSWDASWEAAKSSLVLHGGDKEAETSDPAYTSDYLTAKGATWITPEIIGGNGDLYYWYSYPTGKDATSGEFIYKSGYNKNVKFMAADTGTSDSREDQKKGKSASIVLQVGDLKGAYKGSGKYDFKIYDSTEETYGVPDLTETVTEPTSQHADITLYMDNQVNDEDAPTGEIARFHWKGIKDNSIYGSKDAEDPRDLAGHIELEYELPAAFKATGATAYTPTLGGVTYPAAQMDRDPKVSGKIVIRGEAFDAIRLNSLYVTLPDFVDGEGNGLAGLVDSGKTGSGGAKFYKMAEFDAANTAWKYNGEDDPVDFDEKGWSFKVESSEFTPSGHTVSWSLALDTSKYKGGTEPAGADVLIEFMALDMGKPTCDSGTKYTSVDGETKYKATSYAAKKPSDYSGDGGYKMDIVPYVVKVYTNLAKANTGNWSVYNRTASGAYPVSIYKNSKEDSSSAMDTTDTGEVVQIYGFNLNGLAYSDAIVPSATAKPEDDNSDYNCYDFKAGALTGTGSQEVAFKVGNVYTLNNINANDAKGSYSGTASDMEEEYSLYANYYNRLPNDSNNNRLTDDLKFDVWQLNNSAAVPISNKILDPVMKINPKSGMIGFAFENDPTYFSMPTSARSYDYWAGCYDKITVPAFDYIYSATDQGEVVALAQGNDISGVNADNFMFYYSKWKSSHSVAATGQQNNGYGLEQIGYKYGSPAKNYWDKSRFQGTSIATAEKRVYLAYYDRVSSQIRFRSSLTKNVPDTIGKREGEAGYVAPDFGNIISRNGRKTEHGIPSWSNPVANAQIFAAAECSISTIKTKYKPGQHLCLAAKAADTEAGETDDLVVIVWYDGNDCYYSYNRTPSTDRATGTNKFDETTGWADAKKIFSGAGQYCKVAFDHHGGVHIAAYDSNNSCVRYAYSDMPTDYSKFKTCMVDAMDAGGSYLTLDVGLNASGAPVPQIGYYSSSCAKPVLAKYNGDDLRMPATTKIAGAEGKYMTGVWEISAVPSTSNISKDRVNVALRKDSDGYIIAPKTGVSYWHNVASGYGSDSYGFVYGLANKNAVLGYCRAVGAKTYIETAQRK